jgi:hypothetical protein
MILLAARLEAVAIFSMMKLLVLHGLEAISLKTMHSVSKFWDPG